MGLEVKIADERDMVILALEGRVDISTIEEFNHGLDEVKRRGKKNIILMFRDLESLDSQGAAELLSFLRWVEEENGEVKIAEVQPEIMGILKILGFDTMTRFSVSLAEAMQSFRKPKGEEEMEKEKDLFVNDVFQRPSRPEGSRMTLIFLAAGVFLFLILLIIYMTRESSSDLQPLQKRIAFLEQKMAQVEGQNKELSAVSGRIDSLRKELTERAQQLEKEMAKLRMEKESAPQKVAPTPPPEEKPAQKPARVHAVMRGETLYGISKKYGLSVEELRRLNNLKPNQQIMVGQKLNVGS